MPPTLPFRSLSSCQDRRIAPDECISDGLKIGTMRPRFSSCLFGDSAPTYASPAEQDEPFSLTDDAPLRKATVNVRARQQVFRFQVLAQYGAKCAVCSIMHPSLVKAAHIRGKREKGSDDWRNGIPLCSTHHDAYDAQLFAIHPDTLSIITGPDVNPTAIGLGTDILAVKQRRPHREALAWRFQLTQSKWKTKVGV